MVNERDFINHFKGHIKKTERMGKIFKVNSVMGTLNHNKPMREWWKERYVAESTYLPFFLSHRREFIYNPLTGAITINDNPFKRPQAFEAMLQSASLKEAITSVKRIDLLIAVFNHLKFKVTDPVGGEEAGPGQVKMRGEIGVPLDDLLVAMAALNPNPILFLTPEEAKLQSQFKTFIREFKGFVSIAKGQSVKFDDSVVNMVEDVESEVEDLAKEALKSLITAFLKEDFSGTKSCSLKDLALFLNTQVKFLAKKVFGSDEFDQNDVRKLVEGDEKFKLIQRAGAYHVTLADPVAKLVPAASVLLFEDVGEFIRELKGSVTKIRNETIFLTGDTQCGQVEFKCTDSDHVLQKKLKIGDEATFTARYDKNEQRWNAVKIQLIVHAPVPGLAKQEEDESAEPVDPWVEYGGEPLPQDDITEDRNHSSESKNIESELESLSITKKKKKSKGRGNPLNPPQAVPYQPTF